MVFKTQCVLPGPGISVAMQPGQRYHLTGIHFDLVGENRLKLRDKSQIDRGFG